MFLEYTIKYYSFTIADGYVLEDTDYEAFDSPAALSDQVGRRVAFLRRREPQKHWYAVAEVDGESFKEYKRCQKTGG